MVSTNCKLAAEIPVFFNQQGFVSHKKLFVSATLHCSSNKKEIIYKSIQVCQFQIALESSKDETDRVHFNVNDEVIERPL